MEPSAVHMTVDLTRITPPLHDLIIGFYNGTAACARREQAAAVRIDGGVVAQAQPDRISARRPFLSGRAARPGCGHGTHHQGDFPSRISCAA
jgi:hypothetical protein